MSPLMTEFFRLMEQSGINATDLAEMTGISRSTFYSWKSSRVPTVDNVDAAARPIGYTLKLVKINE